MERITESVPDLVLADVHMPGLNGYQICEMVRQNPQTKDLPVVLLVGSFEPFDESEAARVGANAYLTKPFQSIRQLVSQVTDLMPAAQPPTETAAEQLSAPGEGEEPEQPPEKVRDTTDIESLYHQSFTEPGQTDSETSSTSARYVDAGMDDEMIETTSVSDEYAQPSQDSGPEPDQAFSYSAHDGEAGAGR